MRWWLARGSNFDLNSKCVNMILDTLNIMTKAHMWVLILSSVALATAANAISTNWASKADKLNIWLPILIVISPLVFITFGLVTSKLGLAVTSGTIDSLLTITTILVGIVVYNEWSKLSVGQLVGLLLAATGILLMVFTKK